MTATIEEQHLRVLIVDDDEAFLESLTQVLSTEFEVTASRSPNRALALAQANAYDVVISDWQMPELDGLSFVRALLGSGCKASCLVLTGRSNELLSQMGFGTMGTVAALYLRIRGGWTPCGMSLKESCPNAVTCDIARLMSTPGWKKSLMTHMPG